MASGFELRDLYGFIMPNLDAAQHARFPVNPPQRTDVPRQRLAHGLKYLGGDFFERTSRRQHLCDGVLDNETLLSVLAFGDVDRGSDKFYDVARLAHDGMADTLDDLDRSIRQNDSKLRLKPSFFDVSFSVGLFDSEPVIGMDPRKKEISSRNIILGLDAPDSNRFRRDCDFSR